MTAKIFKNTFLVGLFVLLLCAAVFFGLQYTQTKEETYDALKQEAVYAAHGLSMSGAEYLKTLDAEHRITWIAADGSVLYDNQYGSKVADQSEFPEVADALSAGEGHSIRRSQTAGADTVYYAVRCEDGTVLRLCRSVGTMRYALVTVSPVLWVAVLVLLVSGALAFRVAHQILEPVNTLDLDHPDASKTYSEIAPLVERIEEQNLTIREREEELGRQQREFSALTDSMSEGFLLLDRSGIVLTSNRSARDLMPECVPEADFASIAGADAAGAVKDALSGKRAEITLADGDRRVRLIANPVMTDGRLSGAVILTLDVTEQEQREALRREFSANVSHELKTPLTSISGFAELLMRGMVSPDMTAEFAEDIYKESSRMIALVDDIIKLSKLDENAVAPDWVDVDLYDLSENVLDSLRASAATRNVQLALTGDHATVRGDWRILNEMVYNLCDNAIKYNREGGEATVEIAQDADAVRLTVRDTGIGIPYAHRNRVFERFYRVDKSHSRENGGTGLGLSIVKHGAQIHGARIELESEVDVGTRITLVFPSKNGK